MAKTMFRKLVDQLQVLAPMCKFEMPEVLCDKKELYFRHHYAQLDKEIKSLAHLLTNN